MQINHPNVVACQGYGYGAVQKPTDVYSSMGDNFVYLGERVFNCHPFRDDVQGWPIRWEMNEHDRADLASHREFLASLG
jgi:hypothetical protein